jgi:hypothetical protein
MISSGGRYGLRSLLIFSVSQVFEDKLTVTSLSSGTLFSDVHWFTMQAMLTVVQLQQKRVLVFCLTTSNYFTLHRGYSEGYIVRIEGIFFQGKPVSIETGGKCV